MKSLKLFRKSAMLLVIGCVICSTTIAGQKEKPKCDDVLSACLDYTKILEAERDLLASAIKRQDVIIRDLEGKQSSQPWYFWVLIGAASGIVITGVK